jgi:hypothetical protein
MDNQTGRQIAKGEAICFDLGKAEVRMLEIQGHEDPGNSTISLSVEVRTEKGWEKTATGKIGAGGWSKIEFSPRVASGVRITPDVPGFVSEVRVFAK